MMMNLQRPSVTLCGPCCVPCGLVAFVAWVPPDSLGCFLITFSFLCLTCWSCRESTISVQLLELNVPSYPRYIFIPISLSLRPDTLGGRKNLGQILRLLLGANPSNTHEAKATAWERKETAVVWSPLLLCCRNLRLRNSG